jgi:DNA-directed RNA polymerase subunit beta'
MGEVTNIGTILINEALPEDLRKAKHNFNKAEIGKLFQVVAEKYPDQYQDILSKLSDVGRTAAWTEGASVSLSALRKSKIKELMLLEAKKQVSAIINDDSLDDKAREEAITGTLLPLMSKLQDAVYKESKEENSPYVMQLESGARGKKADLGSMRGADLLSQDQHDRLMPIPIWHSYAEGYTPAEYFASTFSQRKGAVAVKLGVGDAGYMTKRLSNAAHRLVVSRDKPEPTRLPVGLPVPTDDKDSIGSVLAKDAGNYSAGSVITAKMLSDIKDGGVDEILIHSTITEPSPDGGISSYAAGRRDRAGLSMIGDNIGLKAAQAIGEKLSQGQLSAKHSLGAKAKASRSGIEYLNRLLDAPEEFEEAGPLSEADGVVDKITPAPQGGNYISIGGRQYYAHSDLAPIVKPGDHVETGDDLTDGVPHPSQLVKLRGMGEARRVYINYLKEGLENSGTSANRRNIEPVVTGLLNWAEVTNPDGIDDNVYGDIIPFNKLSHSYKPRKDAKLGNPNQMIGNYLEEPVLHYTPGTRINKKVAKKLQDWNISEVYSHPMEPDFQPHMIRSIQSVYHDPDWRTRLVGFYTSSAFDKALHRGAESDTNSTSYAPAVAKPSILGQKLNTLGKYGSVKSFPKLK